MYIYILSCACIFSFCSRSFVNLLFLVLLFRLLEHSFCLRGSLFVVYINHFVKRKYFTQIVVYHQGQCTFHSLPVHDIILPYYCPVIVTSCKISPIHYPVLIKWKLFTVCDLNPFKIKSR